MVRSPKRHFEAIARVLAESEWERRAEAAREDPGTKILRSLRWSDALLADYRRRLEDPSFARLEGERALGKAGLHAVWRRLHRSP